MTTTAKASNRIVKLIEEAERNIMLAREATGETEAVKLYRHRANALGWALTQSVDAIDAYVATQQAKLMKDVAKGTPRDIAATNTVLHALRVASKIKSI